jgi:mRNA-degrading endonuclease toxin of MazEF toxin-antitoxin module
MQVFRGDLYYVYLDPVFGHEMGGYKQRPVVIVSINDLNSKDGVVAVIPGTSAGTKLTHYRNIVLVQPVPTNGLDNPTIFDCRHLRGIDKGRLVSRPIGRLSAQELRAIEDAVKYTLGFFGGPPTGRGPGQ